MTLLDEMIEIARMKYLRVKAEYLDLVKLKGEIRYIEDERQSESREKDVEIRRPD